MVQVNRFKQVLLPVINPPAHTGQLKIPPKLSLIVSEERQKSTAIVLCPMVCFVAVGIGEISERDSFRQRDSVRQKLRAGVSSQKHGGWHGNPGFISLGLTYSIKWSSSKVKSVFFITKSLLISTIRLLQLYRETLPRERARVTPPSFSHVSYTVPHHRANVPLKLFCYL